MKNGLRQVGIGGYRIPVSEHGMTKEEKSPRMTPYKKGMTEKKEAHRKRGITYSVSGSYPEIFRGGSEPIRPV